MGSGVVQGASEPAESLIPFSEKVLIGFSLFERAPSISLRYSSGSCRQSMNAVCTDNEMLYFLHISMPSRWANTRELLCDGDLSSDNRQGLLQGSCRLIKSSVTYCVHLYL